MIHLLNECPCSEHTPSLLAEALAPWDTFCMGFNMPTCSQEALPSMISMFMAELTLGYRPYPVETSHYNVHSTTV